MAFANPLVINYAAGTKSLPKVNQDNYGSEYYLRESTQEFTVKIRNTRETPKAGSTAKIERHNVELTRTVFAVPGVSAEITQQVFLVFRLDKSDSVADAAELGAALTDLLDESHFNDLGKWLS